MDNLRYILCFMFLLLCCGSVFSQKQDSTRQVVVVEVDGLSCPFCAYGLEKQFKEVPGVAEIKIDVEKGLLLFKMSSRSVLTDKSIRRLVKKAGFTPREITIQQDQSNTEGY